MTMTRRIDHPNVTPTANGFSVKGRKYKVTLVERGIFNPIDVVLHVDKDDLPYYGTDSKKQELGIHRAITMTTNHDDYVWIFDKSKTPLKDDIPYLTIEMQALAIMNKDMRL